jgi:hypothetical protein
MADTAKNLFNKIITGDEIWCFAYDPETQRDILSSCHGTEPAGLLKYLQNMSRVCLAEAVTDLRILDF